MLEYCDHYFRKYNVIISGCIFNVDNHEVVIYVCLHSRSLPSMDDDCSRLILA